MANTRSSSKRARQAVARQERNQIVRSTVRTAIKSAVEAVASKNVEAAKKAYIGAIKALSKAASKGVIPKTRAARKISRLTHATKKSLPSVLA